jgi:hypothetical protein
MKKGRLRIRQYNFLMQEENGLQKVKTLSVG